jgi:chromosome segregation protein
MYLKKIELLGFKSFADKTEFFLEPGIACIVGPNGSGKSNLTEALRWVLGEQRMKHLRGSKLQEIIFSGSQSRKPLSYAQVSLILNNQDKEIPLDYSEVYITRRTFRDGESEYFINKSPCRLKDIQQLFLGTGVGKDIYSFIAQGEIDLILSTKPEDRREIFEEVAGISKFKYKKKETLRKLENTHQKKTYFLRLLHKFFLLKEKKIKQRSI